MEKTLGKLIDHLKEVSSQKHNQGAGLHDVSTDLSEWNFGFSEGVEYAIDKLEVLTKEER